MSARNNQPLKREDLWTLEEYARRRAQFRNEVMAHKKKRQLALGDNVLIQFEDRLTMHYQIQEILRVEKIFEEDGIQEELQAYNPLIPDGNNWKATMMIEYPDPEKRQAALARLVGIESQVWVQIQGQSRVSAIADEDLERATEEKTSAVHFLRFQLDPDMIAALRRGAHIAAGIAHEHYSIEISRLDSELHGELVQDLV